jgi:flagellar biogenesis protein FliO
MKAMTTKETPLAGKGLSLRRIFALLAQFFIQKRAGENGVLRIEERLSLGPKKMLFLIDCGGRKFLLAAGAETIHSITEVKAEDEQRRSRSR